MLTFLPTEFPDFPLARHKTWTSTQFAVNLGLALRGVSVLGLVRFQIEISGTDAIFSMFTDTDLLLPLLSFNFYKILVSNSSYDINVIIFETKKLL